MFKNNKKSRDSHRADFRIKIAVACVMIFLLVASIKMNFDINDRKEKLQALQLQIEELSGTNDMLKAEIDSFVLDEDTIKRIAKEELGLVESDTYIIKNSQPN